MSPSRQRRGARLDTILIPTARWPVANLCYRPPVVQLARLMVRIRRSPPERILSAVRIAGAGVVAALGQALVDMPSGYFGAVERSTLLGAIFAAVMLAGMGGCAVATLIGARLSRWLFPALAIVGMAFFLPAIATDVGHLESVQRLGRGK